MAGGTYDALTGKVRPGVYINFKGSPDGLIGSGERGTVLIPLPGHEYGPEKEFIRIENSSPDAAKALLGYSVFDAGNKGMLLIREAFKKAKTVIVYISKSGAIKAAATLGNLQVTAKYSGARGNDIKLAVVAVPASDKFCVDVYLDNAIVEAFEEVGTVGELPESLWVDFSGEGALEENAGTNLSGGENGTSTNSDIAEFLDGSEGQSWNTLAFPIEDCNDAVKTKIRYLREDTGKYRKAVCANFAADYEGIINVTNGVRLKDGTEISAALATAFVAGLDASSPGTQSNTDAEYDGAADIIGLKNHSDSVEAINKGEFFFSPADDGRVVVEYDINSLVTFKAPKNKSYRKNKIIRIFDSFAETVKSTFKVSQYTNDLIGWDLMEGIGKSILKAFEDSGAITNVDYDADFKVNKTASKGDSTYFNVRIQAVDSAEKLYFEIMTD